MRTVIVTMLGILAGMGPGVVFAQGTQTFEEVIFTDTFDTGASSVQWPPIPGRINGFYNHKLEGSTTSGYHDHTGNEGQCAVAFPNNPVPYGAYHEFDAQPAHIPLKLSVWVYDQAHDTYCPEEDGVLLNQQTRGLVGLTSVPGTENIADPPMGEWNRPNVVYAYEDWAFLGVQVRHLQDPTGPDVPPEQFHYRWYTKTDGWHTTTVVRKAEPVCGGPTVWKHFEIVVHPYTGQVGDIQFFIDGQLVGEGRRAAGTGGQGAEFRRISLGTRFPENSDLENGYGAPLYSYEFYRFDDVKLSLEALTCNVPRFDADGDGDVDQVDFGIWQRCFTGEGNPGGLYDRQACGCMNSDGDTDIDLVDWDAFMDCLSGPDIPAPADCDAGLPPS